MERIEKRHVLSRPVVYTVGIRAMGYLPRRLAYFVGGRMADISYLLYRRARENVKINLRSVFPDADPGAISSLALRTFRNYSKYLVDYGRFSYLNKGSLLREMPQVDGRENIEDALKGGNGTILLTAHLGNWELGGIFFGKQDIKINVLTLRDGIGEIDEIREKYRNQHNIKTIVLGDSPFAGLEVLNALRRNEIVAMLVDRTGEEGIPVEFFGKTRRFPAGPLILARATGAAIMPAFVVRDKNGYKAVAEKPIYVDPDNRESNEKVAQAVTNIFEKYIRKYPDQWYNFVPV